MSRYNSAYSGSQIDWAVASVISGYPLAVGTGSLILSGTLNVQDGITGSLLGTASYADTATSSSYALSSSYAISASYAETASYVVTSLTASYFQTASITPSASWAGNAYWTESLAGLISRQSDVDITGSLRVKGNYGDSLTVSSSGEILTIADGITFNSYLKPIYFQTLVGGNIQFNSADEIAMTGANGTYFTNNIRITGSLNVSGSTEIISGSSLILSSPDGTRWSLTVSDTGVVSASAA